MSKCMCRRGTFGLPSQCFHNHVKQRVDKIDDESRFGFKIDRLLGAGDIPLLVFARRGADCQGLSPG